jgi:Flp pilus assembly protein TadD
MRSLRFTIAAVGLCAVLLSLCSCASTPEAKSAKFIAAGKKLMQKNDTSRAILQFQSAVKTTPKNPEAHYQLAAALLAAGDVMHASLELRRSLELNPKHQGAELLMAKLLASTNDKGFVEDAEKRLQALLQDSPDDPDALHALAFTELK